MGTSTDGLLVWGVCLSDGVDLKELLDHAGISVSDDDEPEEHLYSYLEKFNCTLEVHCSSDYFEYIIKPNKGLSFTAYRGYPQKIDSLPTPSEEQVNNLKKACEALGLTFDPQWWLASWWG